MSCETEIQASGQSIFSFSFPFPPLCLCSFASLVFLAGLSPRLNVENPAMAESSFDMSTEVVERMGINRSSTGSSEGWRTFMACTPNWKV